MNRIPVISSAVLIVTDAVVDARIGLFLLLQDAWTARRDEEGLTPVFVMAVAIPILWTILGAIISLMDASAIGITLAWTPFVFMMAIGGYVANCYHEQIMLPRQP